MDKISPLPDANSEGAAIAATEAELGRQNAKRVAKKFAPWVMQTSPWMSGEISAPSVEEFLEANPDRLARLYAQAFPLFDDLEEVARMRATGFDGTKYGGVGFNADEIEFRVFDVASVREVTPGEINGMEISMGHFDHLSNRQ